MITGEQPAEFAPVRCRGDDAFGVLPPRNDKTQFKPEAAAPQPFPWKY